MDEPELDEHAARNIAIRISRDGEITVTYDGDLVPVSSIDIDRASLDRLAAQPKTVRDQ